MKSLLLSAIATTAVGAGLVAMAEPGGAPVAADLAIPAERATVAAEEMTIALSKAFPDIAAVSGRTFRARKIALAPGASTAETEGGAQPSIYYVTVGAVVERRSDRSAPIARKRHEAASFDRGVTHVIENASDRPAEILIVDIIAAGAS